MIRYLLVLSMLADFHTTQRIILAGNNSSPLVQQNTRVRLSCSTDTQWFFCLWKGPTDDIQCAIQYDEPTSVCKENPRIQLIGGAKQCDIVLQVTPEDHGKWMCLVNDIEEFDAKKRFVDLNIAIEAEIQVSVEGGRIENDTLVSTEGDTLTFKCEAEGGYPAPGLTWFGPSRPNQTNALQVFQSGSKNDPGSHTVSVTQTVRFVPELNDTNKTISCMMMQTEAGITQFTRTVSHRLHVERRLVGSGGPLTQGVSHLSWIIILIILVMLSCILLVGLLVRRSRKKKEIRNLLRLKEEQHSLFDEDDHEAGELTPRIYSQRPQYNEYRNHLSDCNGQRISNEMLERFTEISQSRVPLTNGANSAANGSNSAANGSNKTTNGGTAKPVNGLNGNGHLPVGNGKEKSRKKFNNETEVVKETLPTLPQTTTSADCESCQLVRNPTGRRLSSDRRPDDRSTDRRSDRSTDRRPQHWETKLYRPPSPYLSRSQSASDLSISYSGEDLTKSCRLLSSKLRDEPFKKQELISPGSVPHLDRLPCRTLVNPTKSLASLGKEPNQPSRRRRRKTVSTCKSTNSVFDCEEGCFNSGPDETHKSQQIVIVSTGPVVL